MGRRTELDDPCLGLAQSNNSNEKIINTDNQWDIICLIDIGESSSLVLSIAFCYLPERWRGEIWAQKNLLYWQLWFLSQSNYSWLITCQTRAYHQKCDCFKNQSNSAGARPLPPTSCRLPGCSLAIVRYSQIPLVCHICHYPSLTCVWCWPRVSPLVTVSAPGKLLLRLAGDLTGRRPVPVSRRARVSHRAPPADLVTSRAKIPDYRDLNVFVLHSLFRLYLFGEGKCNLWKMDYQDNIVRLPARPPRSVTFTSTK